MDAIRAAECSGLYVGMFFWNDDCDGGRSKLTRVEPTTEQDIFRVGRPRAPVGEQGDPNRLLSSTAGVISVLHAETDGRVMLVTDEWPTRSLRKPRSGLVRGPRFPLSASAYQVFSSSS